MLPADLLRVRVVGRRVLPKYSRLGFKDIALASKLVDLYSRSVGSRLGGLLDGVEALERWAERELYDYKFFRGLVHILNRRVAAEREDLGIDPFRVRRYVFRLANELYKGFVLNSGEWSNVINRAARELGCSAEVVWRAFNSVYEEELVVKDFNYISPEDLLREYNLSLTQTLLFKCLRLYVDAALAGYEAKAFLRRVKMLGLLYMAERSRFGVRVVVDGPASVVKHTERYGVRLAKLVPTLLRFRAWGLRAELRLGRRRAREAYFTLSSAYLPPLPSIPEVPPETFDSGVEEEFARLFRMARSGWDLIREPEPLVVGHHVFIPDFALVKGGRKAYLEIVGFWTEDYLKRKVEKLGRVREPIVVAVNEELGRVDIPGRENLVIVTFKERLSPLTVLRALRRWWPEKERGGTERKPVIEIVKEVGDVDGLTLKEVEELLRARGIEGIDVIESLRRSGYRIEWRGISPSEAKVVRSVGNQP